MVVCGGGFAQREFDVEGGDAEFRVAEGVDGGEAVGGRRQGGEAAGRWGVGVGRG